MVRPRNLLLMVEERHSPSFSLTDDTRSHPRTLQKTSRAPTTHPSSPFRLDSSPTARPAAAAGLPAPPPSLVGQLAAVVVPPASGPPSRSPPPTPITPAKQAVVVVSHPQPHLTDTIDSAQLPQRTTVAPHRLSAGRG